MDPNDHGYVDTDSNMDHDRNAVAHANDHADFD